MVLVCICKTVLMTIRDLLRSIWGPLKKKKKICMSQERKVMNLHSTPLQILSVVKLFFKQLLNLFFMLFFLSCFFKRKSWLGKQIKTNCKKETSKSFGMKKNWMICIMTRKVLGYGLVMLARESLNLLSLSHYRVGRLGTHHPTQCSLAGFSCLF